MVVDPTTHTQLVEACTITHSCCVEDQVVRGMMLDKRSCPVCQLPLLINRYQFGRGTLVVITAVLGVCCTKYRLSGMSILCRMCNPSLTETSNISQLFPKDMDGIQ